MSFLVRVLQSLEGTERRRPAIALSIVVVIDVVALLPDVVADDVPDAERLEIHHHHQCPFRIVSPCEHRPRDVGGRPLDDALDDAWPGVPGA
jgi:hypothetical protein